MTIGRIPGATGIQPTIVDAKGDIIAATAADSVTRLVAGANETRLVADSAEATGLKYVADTTNYAVAAKGDLLAGTAADTVAALTVGANNTVLTADSSTATGLKWATPTTAGANWSLLNSGGTSLSSTTTTISGISGKDKIMILWKNASSTADTSVYFRLNGDTGSNYYNFGWGVYTAATYNNLNLLSSSGATGAAGTAVEMAYWRAAASTGNGFVLLSGCNASGVKIFNGVCGSHAGTDSRAMSFGGYYDSSSTISSISLVVDGGSFDAGTVYVYTSA